MVKRITLRIFCFLFLLSGLINAQGISIKGVVKDEKGEPVPYARVVVEPQNQAAITDFEGNYEIKNLPENAAGTTVTININCISFAPLKEQLTLSAGVNQKDFALITDALMLDDLVVIGYGSARTKDLTGAATKVGEKDFN